MPRKLSLSFLGTGGYLPTRYFFPGEHADDTYETPLVQLAVYRHLARVEGFGPADRRE